MRRMGRRLVLAACMAGGVVPWTLVGVGVTPVAHAQAGVEAPQPRRFTPQVVAKTGPPVPISATPDVSAHALINGVTSTRAQCDAIQDAVWVSITEGTACIRYFAAGLPAQGGIERAVAYFSGDVWEGRPAQGYVDVTLARLQASAGNGAAATGLPYVFVARPGTYGSSGDHMQRRRKYESLLMSAALDEIKARLRIREWVAVGYSGGGHVVASLISMRSDLVCAVPIAAPSSPALRARLLNWSTDSTGHDDSYEPTEHLHRDRMHPGLKVLVVGDPKDGNAVWPAQVILADRLTAIGVPNAVIPAAGSGPRSHFGQGARGLQVAAWCAQGLSLEEIAARAAAAPATP